LCEGDYPASVLSLDGENPYITVMCKDFGERELYLILNTDADGHSVKAELSDGEILGVDLKSLTEYPIDCAVCDGVARISLDLPAFGAVVIARKKDK
jgi:hypothetical protein